MKTLVLNNDLCVIFHVSKMEVADGRIDDGSGKGMCWGVEETAVGSLDIWTRNRFFIRSFIFKRGQGFSLHLSFQSLSSPKKHQYSSIHQLPSTAVNHIQVPKGFGPLEVGSLPGSRIGALGLATGGTAHARCWSRKAVLVVCWFGEWTVALGKKSQTEHVFLSF